MGEMFTKQSGKSNAPGQMPNNDYTFTILRRM